LAPSIQPFGTFEFLIDVDENFGFELELLEHLFGGLGKRGGPSVVDDADARPQKKQS